MIMTEDKAKEKKTRPGRFLKGKTYKYGVLKKESDLFNPQWAFHPIIRSGEHFHRLETPTLETFLNKNPESLRPQYALTFFELDDRGEMSYFGAGNPLPRNPTMSGVDEDATQYVSSVPKIMQQQPEPDQSEQVAQEMIAALREQLNRLNDQVAGLLNDSRSKDQYYADQIAELQAQLMAAQTELTKAKSEHADLLRELEIKKDYDKQLQGLADEIRKEQQNNSGGLDGIKELLGVLLPVIQPLLAGGGQPGAPAPKPMVNPQPVVPPQQQPVPTEAVSNVFAGAR